MLFRDSGASLATLFIMVITLSLLTSLFFIRGISEYLIERLEDQIDISTYFTENATEEDILRVQQELGVLPEVREVRYVSKEEALEKFVKAHERDPVILDSLDAVGYNPLLASLNVKAWDAQQYERVSEVLEKSPYTCLLYTSPSPRD